MELYRTYRPSMFKDVLGQDSVIKSMRGLLKKKNFPHASLTTGLSGCGKTTLLRIVANKLCCGEHDFTEMNCADMRGIEDIRKIRNIMSLKPISGDVRVWILDECHKMTNDAQNMLLKVLEECPEHCYFMLASTDPVKLLRTIQTRCMLFKVNSVDDRTMEEIIERVRKKEKIKLTEDVRDKIIKHANNSPRQALVLLHLVSEIKKEADQLDAIEAADVEVEGFKIAQALMNPRSQWADVSKLIDSCKDEAEGIRRIVLGYASKCMNGNSAMRAYVVIRSFRNTFFSGGMAELKASAFEVVVLSKRPK